MHTDLQPVSCPNCGTAFAVPRPKYCGECGQESTLRPPRIGEFLQQFGGAWFATEGALWRTLKLLPRPGALTAEYFAGRRRRYVLPLRLYLTVSLAVLLLLRLVGGLEPLDDTQVVRPDAARPAAAASAPRGAVGLTFSREGFECTGLPAPLCKRLQQRYGGDPAALPQQVRALGDRVLGSLGSAMFVLLPAFALWLKLAYRNRGLRYAEHLVFALHVHTFWFLMLALAISGIGVVADTAALAVPVYTLLAMRRVYGGRWGPRLARAAVVSVLYGATLAVTMAGVVLWALLL